MFKLEERQATFMSTASHIHRDFIQNLNPPKIRVIVLSVGTLLKCFKLLVGLLMGSV